MPRGDGNGPMRVRLRGSGKGIMGAARASGTRPLGRGLMGLGIPVITALIHDVTRPDGFLRPFLYKLMHRKPVIKVIDANYERIEDGPKKIEEQ